MIENLLTIKDLHVDFDTPYGVVHAVRGVDLSVRSGETLGIVGESGSGKSVTMLAAMGLLPKNARATGSVRYRDTEILNLPSRALREFRGAKIAMIFQDPMSSLNPVHKVGDQIAEAMRAHQEVTKAAARGRAAELLDLVGVPDARTRAKQYPHEFSGGMRQRVMIAMAMINQPDVLIADEPTTALDVTIQAQVLEALHKVREEFGTSIVLITHDLGIVARMVDRVAVMYSGSIVERGIVDDVFIGPRHPYTIGLLRSLPRATGTGPLTPIPGAPPSMVKVPAGCPFHPRCFFAQDRCALEPTPLREIAEE
ncbi:MAG: ABC transporter ATP-binding protein, partial [Actinomycetota bacterium]|nr:ABC transporter ATP-binding protein [Actinomycetota bacterium]